MTVKSVRAAIQEALTQDRSCAGPNITGAAAKKITKAALADRYNYKREQKVIKDFFETRRAEPAPGTVTTLACPESSRPAFDAAAERQIRDYLTIPANGTARGAGQ